MKHIYKLLILLFFTTLVPLMAQGMYGGATGFMFPDSLSTISVSGQVTAVNNQGKTNYFIDINDDGNADYFLYFGPDWYPGADSTLIRPKSSQFIAVKGGVVKDRLVNGSPTLIVYTMDGKVWRDSFDPVWNSFGNNTHMMGQHAGDCDGYAYGYDHSTSQKVNLAGNVLVDTTLFMNLYYLDTTYDGKPDYFLNFGPWWYQPSSGVKRPANSETVSINGGEMQSPGMPVIIVYQLNGNTWRDSSLIGNNFGGMWINNDNDNDTIMNPFDEDDFMVPGSGWHKGMGGMGGMMSDSLFGRMLELNPYNVPNSENENIFKAYEFGMFNGNGVSGMMQNGNCGGMMNFNSNGEFHLHFTNEMLQAYGADKNKIQVKYWNINSNKWEAVSNSSVNVSANTITFSSSFVSSYYILTSDKISDTETNREIPDDYSLKQNYPNPFNPTTVIEFSIPKSGNIMLTIYNILGEKVSTLAEGYRSAGDYSINFNASKLTSGIYFYQLQAGNFIDTKKLILIK